MKKYLFLLIVPVMLVVSCKRKCYECEINGVTLPRTCSVEEDQLDLHKQINCIDQGGAVIE